MSLVAEKLVAEKQGALYEWLQRLSGVCLGGRYQVEEPLDIGGQGILYRARDGESGAAVVLKLARLPYHKPASFGRREVRKVRERLVREADLLRRFGSRRFPGFLDLFVAANPLHDPQRSAEIVKEEPYLIMEFVEGEPLDLACIRHFHQKKAGEGLELKKAGEGEVLEKTGEGLALFVGEVARIVGEESLSLAGEGFCYTDFKPSNFLVRGAKAKSLKFLDAGSLYEMGRGEVPSMSEPYVPAAEQYPQGEEEEVAPLLARLALGRMLFELWTYRQPPQGRPLSLEMLVQSHAPPWLVALLTSLEGREIASWEEFLQCLVPRGEA